MDTGEIKNILEKAENKQGSYNQFCSILMFVFTLILQMCNAMNSLLILHKKTNKIFPDLTGE